MKKLIILMFITATGSLIACAQKLNAYKVPVEIKSSFAKAHQGASASWEKEGANYEANFKEGGKAMSCIIDKKGTILETETDIPVSELPKAVLSYVKEHYKCEKIKEAAKVVRSNGEVNYEAEIRSKDVSFDSNGIFIKEVKD